jgi:DNA-binding LacI/PurR family transcriptional regulator
MHGFEDIDPATPQFFAGVLQPLLEPASEFYRSELIPAPRPDPSEFLRELALRGLHGVAFQKFERADIPFMQAIAAKTPAVALAKRYPDVPLHFEDVDRHTELERLLNACRRKGKRRYAFAAERADHPGYRAYLDTLRAFTRTHGLSLPDNTIMMGPDAAWEHLLELRPRPQVIVAATHQIARRLAAARPAGTARGRAAPELITFASTPRQTEDMGNRVKTVVLDYRGMMQRALDHLRGEWARD